MLLDHNVGTIRISKNSQSLIVFGGVTELEILGRKCLEIADELRAATAAKDEVAACPLRTSTDAQTSRV